MHGGSAHGAAASIQHVAITTSSIADQRQLTVVVFATSSDIEASVVMALLDSHGIPSFRASGQHPLDVADGGERARRDPHRRRRGAGRRGAAHHREPPRRTSARSVVRLRDEFDELQARIGYRFRDRGLLEHALTHKSRAAEDASGGVADNESLEFLGDAVLGPRRGRRAVPPVSRATTKARSRRSRRRWSPRSRWRGRPSSCGSAIT